jgi:hypothetical protein
MKRSFVLTIALVLFVLALVSPTPYASRTVKAAGASPADLCTPCLIAVDRRQELCLAAGGSAQFCGDQFNRGIVFCFKYFCEG